MKLSYLYTRDNMSEYLGGKWIMIELMQSTSTIFESWIDNQKSDRTATEYRRVTIATLDKLFNKSISDLSAEDFNDLTPHEIKKQLILPFREEGYKDSTIKHYFVIIQAFIAELENNRIFKDVNLAYVRSKCFSTKSLNSDGERTAPMLPSDFDGFTAWVKKYKFRGVDVNLPLKYSLLTNLMYRTAIRVAAAIELKWSDIKLETDFSGDTGWTIFVRDKGGKLNKKPISDQMYDELHDSLHEPNKEKIFSGVSKRSFERLMKKYSDETGREINPHSIKVGAATRLYNMTHDLIKVQRFCDHEDPKTTAGYIRDSGLRSDTGSLILSKSYDPETLDKLSKQELLELIKQNKEIEFALINKIKQ